MSLTNVFKIFQTMKKLGCSQEFGLEISSGVIIGRKPKQELSFLHGILLCDVIYVPTNYIQIISNIMGVMACRRVWLQGT